jgi:RNA polymerase sigma-70 factor (ECF subfamily)
VAGDVTTALRELHARGVAAWPEIVVDAAHFAADVTRRLGDVTAAHVAQLHHDVYLAIAAAAGDPRAIRACDEVCVREVEFSTGRLRATKVQGDDVLSELRRYLFTGEDDRGAAISSFTGRGDLRGFVRVIASRTLARRITRDKREVELGDEIIDALAPAIDPELAFLREQYRADVDAAFRAALVALPDRSRAVLRYHLLDGWSIDQIGKLYDVHRATAARWLTTAREDLGARMRAGLAERLAITESQVDSIIALVTSRIEVSLDRLLAP